MTRKKLTAVQELHIRTDVRKLKDIATDYGVCIQTISNIKKAPYLPDSRWQDLIEEIELMIVKFKERNF